MEKCVWYNFSTTYRCIIANTEREKESIMNVLEYARSTERSGALFYREMAERSNNEGVKNIFNMLAEDEEKMLQKLMRMSSRTPGMSEQTCRYLRKGDNVFEKMRRMEDDLQVENDLDAYALARDTERKVMQKYLRAADNEGKAEVRRSLMWIAAMERSELAALEKLFDFVNAPNSSLEWGEFSNLDEFHNFGRYEDR